VVIWLTGGPGCSSELALFYENGPFNIADNLSLVWNDFGWDKVRIVLLRLRSPIRGRFSGSGKSSDVFLYAFSLKVPCNIASVRVLAGLRRHQILSMLTSPPELGLATARTRVTLATTKLLLAMIYMTSCR